MARLPLQLIQVCISGRALLHIYHARSCINNREHVGGILDALGRISNQVEMSCIDVIALLLLYCFLFCADGMLLTSVFLHSV